MPYLSYDQGLNSVLRVTRYTMSSKRYEIKTTCFDKKGNVLSVGYNSYNKSSPWQKELSLKAGLSEHRISLHSEISALLRAKNQQVYFMQIERYDAAGNPKLCLPCPSCMLAIKQCKVKVVRFTTEEGFQELYI